MIPAVSSAAAPSRSTQNTCAPWRAKVTAVALPLPQPGPIEPAPTTIAVLPLSRSIDLPHLWLSFLIVVLDYRCRRARHSWQTRMAVTLAPIGYPKTSDSVRHRPSWHIRHSRRRRNCPAPPPRRAKTAAASFAKNISCGKVDKRPQSLTRSALSRMAWAQPSVYSSKFQARDKRPLERRHPLECPPLLSCHCHGHILFKNYNFIFIGRFNLTQAIMAESTKLHDCPAATRYDCCPTCLQRGAA